MIIRFAVHLHAKKESCFLFTFVLDALNRSVRFVSHAHKVKLIPCDNRRGKHNR